MLAAFLKRGHQGLHGSRMPGSAPYPPQAFFLSAELPVPEQEDKAVVSPAEEACKDCMDGDIQEAASQGQSTWLHAPCSLQRSRAGRAASWLLAWVEAGPAVHHRGPCYQQAHIAVVTLLPVLARSSHFLSGNTCLLHADRINKQQLWDGSLTAGCQIPSAWAGRLTVGTPSLAPDCPCRTWRVW